MTSFLIQRDEYPSSCPKCGSSDIGTTRDDTISTGYVTKHYTCFKCEFRWNELYQFVNWQPQEAEADECA